MTRYIKLEIKIGKHIHIFDRLKKRDECLELKHIA